MKRVLALVACVTVTFAGYGQSRPCAPIGTETVLIPLTYNGPGQNGAEWFTNIAILNTSSTAFSSPGTQFQIICSIPEGCESQTIPGRTFGALMAPNSATGALLYIPHTLRTSIHIQTHIGERTRNGNHSAIEIPIAGGRDSLFGAGNWLLFVPIGSDVRTDLRLYQQDGRQLNVRVSLYPFYDITSGPIETRDVAVAPPAIDDCAMPSALILPLQNAFPLAAASHSFVNILVEPLDPQRFWMMASAVERRTNHVHIVTPTRR
jgi:hypothetical protein